MDILTDLLNRVLTVQAGLESGSLVREILVARGNEIIEEQRIQLLEGKGSDGEDLHPFYSEDLKSNGGYFHSVQSAGRYAAWKQDLDYPYSVSRNPDAPNLYITGKFHDELGIDFGPDSIAIVGLTAYAQRIMTKYGVSAFGLNAEHWDTVWSNGGYNDLLESVKQILFI